MKKLMIAALVVGAALGLAGCGGGGSFDDPSRIQPHTVGLPDGRKVLCVYEYDSFTAGSGLSCDWEHAK